MQINRIEVDTGRINADIESLRTGLEAARDHLKQLSDRITAMNGMWSGDANDVMKLRFQSDYGSLQALCKDVQGLITRLETIRQAYDTCENNVKDVVNSLTV